MSLSEHKKVEDMIYVDKQAGAELCQAQYKL